jgi:TonB family protein
LEEFIAEQKSNIEYDPATERSLLIYGVPGKQYQSANKSTPSIVQFFATEKRLYRFVATGPGVEGRATREFFLSIRLGKDTIGFEVSDGPGLPFVSDTGERIYKSKEVDVKAQITSMPEPYFTGQALDGRTSGTVFLRVILSKTGRVEDIRAIRGLPNGVTERAIDAARWIKFTPAMKDGQPVSMWMQLEYNFTF